MRVVAEGGRDVAVAKAALGFQQLAVVDQVGCEEQL